MTGPYADAADTYWRAGWRGVLPLPARKKTYPPSGFTGAGGVDPSYADIYTWAETQKMGDGNIALRLPADIIGVDVDDYSGKTGGKTLTILEAQLGTLPATWRSTSRDDGISGIRLYRAPAGMSWEDFGDDIEVIHRGWRYVVAWPSIHPEARTYRWIDPNGVTSTVVPSIDDLPMLPETWVERFSKGPALDLARNTLKTDQAATWLVSLDGASDPPCRRMKEAAAEDAGRLDRQEGSAHDVTCSSLARIVRLAAEGHRGALDGISTLRAAFVGNITNPRRAGTSRAASDANREWLDLLTSAINLVSADTSSAPSCDCDGQLTALLLTDKTRTATPAVTDGSSALDVEPSPEPATVADLIDHTTWWPRDLGPVLSGEQAEEPPSLLQRSDGQALWYRGKVNGLIGESESGKTWIALEAVRQCITRGGRTLYLDFEDAAPGIVSRLRALGVSDDVISSRLAYVDPAETLHITAQADLADTLNAHSYDLIIVDGFNAAMTLLGLDLMSNTDATKFSQMLLKPLAKTGAAVAYVDHIPKNMKDETSGGIGAQAKRAMTTGCAIRVKVQAPFGKGMTGELVMTVDKDRAGHVRGTSGGGKNAGTAVLESDPETGGVNVTIQAPDMTTAQQHTRAAEWQRWEDICTFLAGCENPVSTGVIVANLGKRKNQVVDDLAVLEARRHVRDVGTSTRRHQWTILDPFTVAGAMSTPERRSVVPGRSAVVSGTTGRMSDIARSHVPPPIGGTGTTTTAGGPDATTAGAEEKTPGNDTDTTLRTFKGRKVKVAHGYMYDAETGEVVE